MTLGRLLTLPFLLTLTFLTLSARADEKKTVLIVRSYKYLPPEGGVGADAAQTGHSLCGTKCNSVSANFESLMAAGMRMIKTVEEKEIRIPLDNPFLFGDCLCTGDEYEISRNTYRPGVPALTDKQSAPTAR